MNPEHYAAAIRKNKNYKKQIKQLQRAYDLGALLSLKFTRENRELRHQVIDLQMENRLLKRHSTPPTNSAKRWWQR